MIDASIVARCRAKLTEVARARGRITYGQLARHLGVANQSVGLHLDANYEEEIAKNHPDLTVVVVYLKTGLGRFNSRGGPVRSVRVDPNNPDHVRAYNEELARVYEQWSRK